MTTRNHPTFTRFPLLRASLCIAPLLSVLGCDVDGDPALAEAEIEDVDAAIVDAPLVAPDADREELVKDELELADTPRDDALPLAPAFQMPFFYRQKWRASTYNGHFPNQNSIDLGLVSGSSLGQVVVASAAGTVVDVGPVLSPEGDYYGDYVDIDHGDGWATSYYHIVKSAAVAVGTTVVRGQRLGTVGQYFDMGVHLHYTQLKDGVAVRIAFNGVPINVWKGAEKPDSTYPTQDLVSNNIPTGITVNEINGGAAVSSSFGAGVRAVALCENILKDIVSEIEGSRVPAKQTSTAKCPAGWLFGGATYALE